MDSTPPIKPSPKLSKIRRLAEEKELSLEIVPSSPIIASSPKSSIPTPPYTRPLHEFLLLSPSPVTRSKTRLSEKLELADDAAELSGARSRRCKTRNVTMVASPRNNRRSRRRIEQDSREEKDLGLGEDVIVKTRKKRHSGRSKKDKNILLSSTQSLRTNDEEGCNLQIIGDLINDLIMWKDVSKSSLWFGFGSLCFLSSCFTKGINFSFFSMVSHLGFLFLALSFFSNSVRQRVDNANTKRKFKLQEDDILRFGKMILPATNLAISTLSKLFSGEPAMTLKVVPYLLLGAEYGHFITLWRLSALVFFFSFTSPKLYSSYSNQISKKVSCLKTRVLETWEACSHKKVVASSIFMAFWNLTSIKTRVLAGFVCLVVVKCQRDKKREVEIEEEIVEKALPMIEQEKEKALVVVEDESPKE